MDDDVERALAEARALGFLGPGPLDAHEQSAAAFVEALGPVGAEAPALDLGSGGGVPGLLLAAVYHEVAWVLLDINRRRTSFLARTVAGLGWHDRVRVVRASADQAAHEPEHRGRYGVVVSRSFGPPAVTAECAVGFLHRGGRLAVAEPPTGDPGRWPEEGVASLGLQRRPSPVDAVAVFGLVRPPAEELPRAWKVLERRPRW